MDVVHLLLCGLCVFSASSCADVITESHDNDQQVSADNATINESRDSDQTVAAADDKNVEQLIRDIMKTLIMMIIII